MTKLWPKIDKKLKKWDLGRTKNLKNATYIWWKVRPSMVGSWRITLRTERRMFCQKLLAIIFFSKEISQVILTGMVLRRTSIVKIVCERFQLWKKNHLNLQLFCNRKAGVPCRSEHTTHIFYSLRLRPDCLWQFLGTGTVRMGES